MKFLNVKFFKKLNNKFILIYIHKVINMIKKRKLFIKNFFYIRTKLIFSKFHYFDLYKTKIKN